MIVVERAALCLDSIIKPFGNRCARVLCMYHEKCASKGRMMTFQKEVSMLDAVIA